MNDELNTQTLRISDSVTLILGDCLAHLPIIAADFLVTDPPYGIAYKSGGRTGGKWDFVRHQGQTISGDEKPFDPAPMLALGLPFIMWGANFFSDKLPGCGWLVWDKRPGIEDMKFNRSDAEIAANSGSKTVKTFRHLWHGICRDSDVGQHLHPTQKPVPLMAWCMEQARVHPLPASGLAPRKERGEHPLARFIGMVRNQGTYKFFFQKRRKDHFYPCFILKMQLICLSNKRGCIFRSPES